MATIRTKLPPVYDGVEPLYIFRRKMMDYLETQKFDRLSDTLKLINLILNTEYKYVMDMKRVTNLPTKKQVVQILDENEELVKKLGLSMDMMDVAHYINNMLNRLGFSFMEYNGVDGNKYYMVKTYLINKTT